MQMPPLAAMLKEEALKSIISMGLKSINNKVFVLANCHMFLFLSVLLLTFAEH